MNTWMALLRSYAVPEVYGKSHTHWGGTYRIWRQVELTCIQGRNIGVPRSIDPSSSGTAASDPEGRGDVESVDLDLFCEVYFNNVLSGRTVVKKSMGSPDWHEIFLFTDLPPFEKMAIVVWREKRQQKPVTIGTVYITLTNFRRGEDVEGWFPVLFGGATTACTEVGQLRLKLRVDESAVSSIPLRLLVLNVTQGNRVTLLVVFESDGCTYGSKIMWQLIWILRRRSIDGITWTGWSSLIQSLR
jgi:hypothetical protein